jgi:chromosome segregation ATPase
LDKNINFLTSLKQRTVFIDQERVSAGSKEIDFDVLDTYIARLTSLKSALSKNQNQQESLDLLSKPSIALLLEKAREIITQRESEYNNQISLNDSLKQDYTQLVQSVYDLEKEITDISIQLQEKNTQLNFSQQKLATFESL